MLVLRVTQVLLVVQVREQHPAMQEARVMLEVLVAQGLLVMLALDVH